MKFDVIVCGGGTAGVAAGVAAARNGAKTLIVERYGSLGGTQTNGCVTPMMPNYLGEHELSRGVNLEIVAAQAKLQAPATDVPHADAWFDPVALALVLDRTVAEAGAQTLFDATLVGARAVGRRLNGIELMTRAGKLELKASAFIDCTGDAQLGFLAGAELMSGNERGEHQPMTLRFMIAGVNLPRLQDVERGILRLNQGEMVECGFHDASQSALGERVRAAVDAGVLMEGDLGYFQFFSVNGRPGELAFNAPRVAGYDPLDPWRMSEAYRDGREKIARIVAFVIKFVAGFENARLSAVAPLMGIRESRRIVGDYVLTIEDHQSCRKFEDVVARSNYPVDIHLAKGTDYRRFPPGEWHDIPYRCLVSKGFDNLWMAGRCVSADFAAQSAIRIQPVCRAMGEAAGTAAAVAVKRSLSARDVPYGELKDRLDLSLP